MANRDSIFGDEWRKCLREHYKYVIHNQDDRTEETLTPILYNVGFREDELRELYVAATMRDMPENFIPDMEVLEAEQPAPSEQVDPPSPPVADGKTFQTHPAECTCAACMDVVLDIGHDTEGQPLTEPEEPEAAQGNIFAVAKPEPEPEASQDKDDPKQISMF